MSRANDSVTGLSRSGVTVTARDGSAVTGLTRTQFRKLRDCFRKFWEFCYKLRASTRSVGVLNWSKETLTWGKTKFYHERFVEHPRHYGFLALISLLHYSWFNHHE
ncbi:unnamed protein product [Rhodiola kirilowii]